MSEKVPLKYQYIEEPQGMTGVITVAPYESGWSVRGDRWLSAISVPNAVWDEMQQSPATGSHFISEDLSIIWEEIGDIVILIRNGFISGHIPRATWDKMLEEAFWKQS